MCEKRKKKKKKTKKLSQFLKSHISGMPEAISLKFGMWSTEVGGNVYSKICLVSSRQHRATEVRKLRFLSSCQYTHGVARRLLGPHDTLPCVLIIPRNRPALISTTSTTAYQNSFFSRTAQDWNSLPQFLIDLNDFESFSVNVSNYCSNVHV